MSGSTPIPPGRFDRLDALRGVAMILGVVGTALGGLGVLATMGKDLGTAWYPVSLAVLAIPLCWIGGRLYLGRARER